MAAAPTLELDIASAVLAAARETRANADREEARLLQLAVEWAAMHSIDSVGQAASFGDTELLVAGPGEPMVAEFSVHEFGAALELPSEVARSYLGEAVELRYRLPRTWQRVVAGDVQAWRARRIARATIQLSREAATYVDAQVWHVAHKIGPISTDRLVTTAIARFMPEEATAKAAAALERRHFDIHTQHVDSLDGTVEVTGRIDVGDVGDLDEAIGAIAHQLKTCGSTETLDVRRAMALGELARRQLTLDLSEERPVGKRVTLHVHLTPGDPVAGLDALPVVLEQVQGWCRDGQVTVKPVIDLNDRLEGAGYAVPDRVRDQVVLRDPVCVFPWCTRRSRDCDLDHVRPWSTGGATASDNLAPLCRRHHRAKTHGHWTYRVISPGSYAWTSPHGYRYDKHGIESTDHGTPDRPRPRP